MKFYLNEHGLRCVDHEINKSWYLADDGEWVEYSGYAVWPANAAKIEYRFTGLREE